MYWIRLLYLFNDILYCNNNKYNEINKNSRADVINWFQSDVSTRRMRWINLRANGQKIWIVKVDFPFWMVSLSPRHGGSLGGGWRRRLPPDAESRSVYTSNESAEVDDGWSSNLEVCVCVGAASTFSTQKLIGSLTRIDSAVICTMEIKHDILKKLCLNIQPDLEKVQRQASVKMVMDLRVSKKREICWPAEIQSASEEGFFYMELVKNLVFILRKELVTLNKKYLRKERREYLALIKRQWK
jgi:hypothetical protein